MRLWTVHPRYLDTKGLLAAWREGLLAQKVLAGKTKGYRNHPQLERFKAHIHPQTAIAVYLQELCNEADHREYVFQRTKIGPCKKAYRTRRISVSQGQLDFEFVHLLKKLRKRSPKDYRQLKDLGKVRSNSLFRIVPGGVESWERVSR